MPNADKNTAINGYITDMIALESHIEKAINGQLEDLREYPAIAGELRQVHRTVEHHLSDLKELAERRNAGGAIEAIKRAGSAVAGLAAGAIDLVRTEGLPKNLRDDYTAFSLASIGYLMLHTTALSLGEREVADLAHQNFSDYANAVVRLQNLVPAAVVKFLQEDGLPAREDVLSDITRTIKEVWATQSSDSAQSQSTASARNL